MKFTTLRLKNFGKFLDKNIELKEGINLIYGDNEAGKSTIHSFLTGMLFGIEKQRGRASKDDSYSRYQPWETPAIYGGSLDLEYKGKNYRIHRNFHKENKEYKVIDLENGREVLPTSVKGVSFIEGLTEDNYKNTISIEQLKARTDKELASEVQNHITNLSLSKSNQVDIGKAINYLNLKKKQMEGNQTKIKIDTLEVQTKEDMLEEVKIEELASSIKQLEIKLKQEDELNQKEELDKIYDFISLYPEIREKYKQLLRLSEQKKSYEELLNNFQVNSKKDAKASKSKIIYWVLSLLIIITGVIFFRGINTFNSLIIIFGIILTWGVYYIINKPVHGKNPVPGFEKEKIQNSIKDISALIREEEKYILNYGARICEITKVDFSSMNRLEKEIHSLKGSLELKKEESRKKKENLKIDLEKRKWELSILEEKELNLYEKKEALNELKRKLRDEEKEILAINLAMNTINHISSNIHDDFGQNLNKMLSGIMREQTDGKYDDIKIDEKLDVKIEYKDRFIDLDKFSVGTIEQLYFALRLSVAGLIFAEDNMPLILDDTFAYYDEKRLRGVLRMLTKEKDRQILIFTCHKREEQLLKELNIPYHKILLTDESR